MPGAAVEEEPRRLNVYQTCFESLEFRQKGENRGESCVRVALWWTGGQGLEIQTKQFRERGKKNMFHQYFSGLENFGQTYLRSLNLSA